MICKILPKPRTTPNTKSYSCQMWWWLQAPIIFNTIFPQWMKSIVLWSNLSCCYFVCVLFIATDIYVAISSISHSSKNATRRKIALAQHNKNRFNSKYNHLQPICLYTHANFCFHWHKIIKIIYDPLKMSYNYLFDCRS